MLIIKDLCKQYDTCNAVNSLSLEIKKGEIFGFVGPNGAGKTTTMKIAAGLLKATSGQILIDGLDVLNDIALLKRRIGYMPDFFGVYDSLKAFEYMEFYASMYGLTGAKAKKTCLELMDMVNLLDKKDNYVDTLSRGMKQRLCLARSMVHDPQLLLLDEPASGLDPRARFELKEILKHLKDMGKTIMISSHILHELAQICTSVGVMEHGHLIAHGSMQDILSQAKESNLLHIQVIGKQSGAIKLLKENPLVGKLSIQDDNLSITFSGDIHEEAQLLKELVSNGVEVISFNRESGDLETLFMQLTNNNEGGEGNEG